MTDTTEGAPAPKKRSLFKRAAWQDAAKKEDDDMFSHAKDFKNIVAEQNRREEEKRRKATEERRRRQDGQADNKRRRISGDNDEPVLPRSGSGSGSARATRTSSTARSRTPLTPSKGAPDSLSTRYDSLSKTASTLPDHIIDLGDSDDDGDDLSYPSKPINGNSALDYPSRETQRKHDIPVRPLHYVHTIDDDDEDPDEELDPALAALAAKARARAAASARTAINPVNGEPEKSPVVQLLVNPQIPDSNALMVKVRTDHTLEKTRLAWCGKQGYSPAATQDVFFTWKGARVFDSTTIRRLGIEVDSNGNVSVEGDSNIYDDTNLPKVYVEAWTQALFDEHKKEEAADAAAKRKALEPSPEIEEREPTPEPAPKEKKFRLIMKARGKAEFKIQVHPETTFGHIASAYKKGRCIEESQPITLMFDGERLSPMDAIVDSEVEDMDSIDVLLK